MKGVITCTLCGGSGTAFVVINNPDEVPPNGTYIPRYFRIDCFAMPNQIVTITSCNPPPPLPPPIPEPEPIIAFPSCEKWEPGLQPAG